MNRMKIVAVLAGVILTVGATASLAGAASSPLPTCPPHGASEPPMQFCVGGEIKPEVPWSVPTTAPGTDPCDLVPCSTTTTAPRKVYEVCVAGWIPGGQSEPGYDGHNVRPDGSLVDCVARPVAPVTPPTLVLPRPPRTPLATVPPVEPVAPSVAVLVPPVTATPTTPPQPAAKRTVVLPATL